MLLRILNVVVAAYLLSGIMLAPPVIIAAAMHVKIKPSLIPTLIGWGAAALVLVLYLARLATHLA